MRGGIRFGQDGRSFLVSIGSVTAGGKTARIAFAATLLIAAAVLCERGGSLRAATDILVGTPGPTGPTGPMGDPGGPGGPGGLPFPDPVVTNASGNPDLVNDAQSFGGAGGDGGNGGDGDMFLNPNASAGDGGPGANGAVADATAMTNPAFSGAGLATATAVGGAGGMGGLSGVPAGAGFPGMQGAGGLGGNATSLADTMMFLAGGTLESYSFATGGAGGGGAGGGNATSTATGNGITSVFLVTSNAVGGLGGNAGGTGGNGGNATAAASGNNSGGVGALMDNFVGADATGGAGGSGGLLGGSGGMATITTPVTGDFGGSGQVLARQTGGAGGFGTAGGQGGNGADSTLMDAVSGSALDDLHLFQYAIAGDGGGSNGGLVGTAGNAMSDLNAMKLFGDEFFGTSDARGGNGGDGSGPTNGGDGGTAMGSINLNGPSMVNAFLTATGGNGGEALGTGNGGNGADVLLPHLTTGSTPLDLALHQWAFAGTAEMRASVWRAKAAMR